ncbi:MarR family transcriptional regulator, partial [Clavibacter phaseoli]
AARPPVDEAELRHAIDTMRRVADGA